MLNRIVNRKLTVSLFRQSIPLTSKPGPIETLIATKLTDEFDPRKVSKTSWPESRMRVRAWLDFRP